jgi:hypothetical protein
MTSLFRKQLILVRSEIGLKVRMALLFGCAIYRWVGVPPCVMKVRTFHFRRP